jgi:hypothetical protein
MTKRPRRPTRSAEEMSTTADTSVPEPEEPIPAGLRLQSSPPADVIVPPAKEKGTPGRQGSLTSSPLSVGSEPAKGDR